MKKTTLFTAIAMSVVQSTVVLADPWAQYPRDLNSFELFRSGHGGALSQSVDPRGLILTLGYSVGASIVLTKPMVKMRNTMYFATCLLSKAWWLGEAQEPAGYSEERETGTSAAATLPVDSKTTTVHVSSGFSLPGNGFDDDDGDKRRPPSRIIFTDAIPDGEKKNEIFELLAQARLYQEQGQHERAAQTYLLVARAYRSFAWDQRPDSTQARNVITLAAAAATQAFNDAARIRFEIIGDYEGAAQIHLENHHPEAAVFAYNAAARVHLADENPGAAARLYDVVAQIYDDLYRGNAGTQARNQAYTAAAQAHTAAAQAHTAAAAIHTANGNHAAAAEAYHNAAKNFTKYGNHASAAQAYLNAAENFTKSGNHDKATQAHTAAVAAYNNLALTFKYANNYGPAAQAYHDAAMILEKIGDHAGAAQAYDDAAELSEKIGDLDNAAQAYLKAAENFSKSRKHKKAAQAYDYAAECYRRAGKHDMADQAGAKAKQVLFDAAHAKRIARMAVKN